MVRGSTESNYGEDLGVQALVKTPGSKTQSTVSTAHSDETRIEFDYVRYAWVLVDAWRRSST